MSGDVGRPPARTNWITKERLDLLGEVWPTYLPSVVVIALLLEMEGSRRITSNALTNAAQYYFRVKRPLDIRSNRVERRKAIDAAKARFGVDIVTSPMGRPLQELADWLTPERADVLRRLWPGYLPTRLIFRVVKALPGPGVVSMDAMTLTALRRLDLFRPRDCRSSKAKIREAKEAARLEFGIEDDAPARVEAAEAVKVTPESRSPTTISPRIHRGNVGATILVPPGRHPAPVGGYRIGGARE